MSRRAVSDRLLKSREAHLALLSQRGAAPVPALTRGLEQACPECGTWEAAGFHCTWCYLPTGPEDWYPWGSDTARRAAARASAAEKAQTPQSDPVGGHAGPRSTRSRTWLLADPWGATDAAPPAPDAKSRGGPCSIGRTKSSSAEARHEPAPHAPTRSKLLGRVELSDDSCWLWIGPANAAGYGRISYDGTLGYAHRRSYELRVGPIPEDRELDHTCNNRNCINPAHLEPVSHQENQRRIKERGTAARGSRSPRAKLTEDEVLAIVADLDSGVPKPEILLRHPQVTHGAINGIANGTSWTYVTGRERQVPKYTRVTPERRETIIRLAQAGWPSAEISLRVGVGPKPVSRISREAGLSPKGIAAASTRTRVTWAKPSSKSRQPVQAPVKEASR